jgi:hypothetical protein
VALGEEESLEEWESSEAESDEETPLEDEFELGFAGDNEETSEEREWGWTQLERTQTRLRAKKKWVWAL